MKLAKLERVRKKYQEQLITAKDELTVFKKKLATEEKKLKTSIALLKKQEEAKKIKLVEEKRKVTERLLLLQKQKAIYTAKKEKEKREKEKKRLALLKQKALANKYSKTKEKELTELEKLDLFESDHIGEEVALFKEDKGKKRKGFKPFDKWFKFSAGYSTMLKNIGNSNSGREALKGTFTINPHTYYFLGATTSLDLNSYTNPYYQPDFSYSFGYSDWHQDTFSWNYSNYANNKFSPKENESRFNFQSGNWELSYKTKVEDVRLVDTVKFNAKVKYKPSSNSKKVYIKAKTTVLDDVMLSAQLKHNITNKQNRLTLSAKTFVYDKFFVSGSVYEYYKADSIGSNDSEYAYSFGWKDSRKNYPSITYSNYYTPTRWDGDKGPKFNEGTLAIKFNLDF
ncbi:MAG: Unknown protein [uncultured Sulfurovum sp.]|uniref:Uncharacterized protein n=1 Tax=uncultured Sulfurovum sp. TaxID=269237 RepID=A0A6S6U7B5_9BACT|nr:MAG: Unknown protein [uncultured Sulfurovum sp.]